MAKARAGADGGAGRRGVPSDRRDVVAARLAQAPNPLLPHNLSPWGMFLNADIMVKVVMVGLALASLLTWTVWLAKTIELRVAKSLARRHLRMLQRDGNLFKAVDACGKAREKPHCATALSMTASRTALRCAWSGWKRQ